MLLSNIITILGVSFLCVLAFVVVGMTLIPAISISLFFLVFGLSALNYLNHGKFRPFVSRLSANR